MKVGYFVLRGGGLISRASVPFFLVFSPSFLVFLCFWGGVFVFCFCVFSLFFRVLARFFPVFFLFGGVMSKNGNSRSGGDGGRSI